MRKTFTSKSAVWALDFGEHCVTALAARQKPSGEWEIIGQGKTRSLGRPAGEIVKLSDVAESVTEALRLAEQGAGARCRRLYFNFDDAEMRCARPVGSKNLSGEGQISREDVRDAARSAARLVGDFERTPVYTRESDYLIDGKDSVGNPFGVFGHCLDVTLHVILARARLVEQWKDIMRRSQVESSFAVLSLESVCSVVIENAALPRILWDLGDDFVSGGVVERGVLREYCVFVTAESKEGSERVAATSREWMQSRGIEGEIILTGDNAERASWIGRIGHDGIRGIAVSPKNIPGLTEPADASLAGLLTAAAHRERRTAYVKAGGLWAGRVRDKANALIQEYF